MRVLLPKRARRLPNVTEPYQKFVAPYSNLLGTIPFSNPAFGNNKSKIIESNGRLFLSCFSRFPLSIWGVYPSNPNYSWVIDGTGSNRQGWCYFAYWPEESPLLPGSSVEVGEVRLLTSINRTFFSTPLRSKSVQRMISQVLIAISDSYPKSSRHPSDSHYRTEKSR